jgi:hypothetical protein
MIKMKEENNMPNMDGTGPRRMFERGFCRRFRISSKERLIYLENLKKEIDLQIELIKKGDKIDEQ